MISARRVLLRRRKLEYTELESTAVGQPTVKHRIESISNESSNYFKSRCPKLPVVRTTLTTSCLSAALHVLALFYQCNSHRDTTELPTF